MPLVTLPGFAGPSHVLSSVNADAEETINLYPESTPPGTGKVPIYLKGTACVAPFTALGDAPIRGVFHQDGRAFAVGGETFCEVFSDGSLVSYGPVTNDDLPVSFASNGSAGSQVLLISAGFGYIFDLLLNTLTLIADPDFPTRSGGSRGPLMCWFMDGYFGVMIEGTRRFQISALEDGTSWDALDVAERSEGSDNLGAMIRNHREIWALGTQTSEVWYDNGDPLFPFAPIQGVFVEHGIAAPWSAHRRDNTIAWIGLDERGQGVWYAANGYTPDRISTYAVDLDLQRSTVLSTTRAFSQQQTGHLFQWSYTSDRAKSWVFDVTEGLWHNRALWDSTAGTWTPYPVACGMFAFERHLVGSPTTDTIYELLTDVFSDEIAVP